MQSQNRPLDADIDEHPLPRRRTDFWAGSVEKVEIMRRRFEAGEHLHHPLDCNLILVDVQDPVARTTDLLQRERNLKWQGGIVS